MHRTRICSVFGLASVCFLGAYSLPGLDPSGLPVDNRVGNSDATPQPNVTLKRVTRVASPATDCWPKVPFALLRSGSECPAGGAWDSGEVRHILRPGSSVSHQNFLSAIVSKEAVTLQFCVRDPQGDLTGEPQGFDCSNVETEFPRGSYCILNGHPKPNIYERCPSGFNWSVIGLDDSGEANGRKRGALPTGEFFSTFSHYYFCCRNDSNPSDAVVLPTRRSFILFPLSTQKVCQEVSGLKSRMFSIYLDTDYGSYVNFPNRYNAPYAETDSIIAGSGPCNREKRGRGLQIHMCYYSKCDQCDKVSLYH